MATNQVDEVRNLYNERNKNHEASQNLSSELLKFVSDHTTLIFGITGTTLVTIANRLVEFSSFKCPCLSDKQSDVADASGRDQYGYAFIFGPAAVFLCIGTLLNKCFWENFFWCCYCYKECSVKEGDTCPSAEPCNRQCSCGKFRSGITSTGYGVLGFVVWILISLVDGDFLACARTKCVYQETEECRCNTLRTSDEYAAAFRYSQLVGWLIALVLFALGVVAFAIYRCCPCKCVKNNEMRRREEKREELALKCAKSLKDNCAQPSEEVTIYIEILKNNSNERKKFCENFCNETLKTTQATPQNGESQSPPPGGESSVLTTGDGGSQAHPEGISGTPIADEQSLHYSITSEM